MNSMILEECSIAEVVSPSGYKAVGNMSRTRVLRGLRIGVGVGMTVKKTSQR